MKIRGREIGFLNTVKTTAELAKLCPDGDVDRLFELFPTDNKGIPSMLENGAKIIHILNEGYEMNKAFEEPGYEPKILTIEEIMYLKPGEYQELMQSAWSQITAGTDTTVEVESVKKKETEMTPDSE